MNCARSYCICHVDRLCVEFAEACKAIHDVSDADAQDAVSEYLRHAPSKPGGYTYAREVEYYYYKLHSLYVDISVNIDGGILVLLSGLAPNNEVCIVGNHRHNFDAIGLSTFCCFQICRSLKLSSTVEIYTEICYSIN